MLWNFSWHGGQADNSAPYKTTFFLFYTTFTCVNHILLCFENIYGHWAINMNDKDPYFFIETQYDPSTSNLATERSYIRWKTAAPNIADDSPPCPSKLNKNTAISISK